VNLAGRFWKNQWEQSAEEIKRSLRAESRTSTARNCDWQGPLRLEQYKLTFPPMSVFGPAPEDEADIDREIRIEKMKRELDDLAGGSMVSGDFGEVSPALEEGFLAKACEFEKAPLDTNFNRLVQLGLEMSPSAELDEKTLPVKLHELLNALASIGCFVENTDHLSDRQLFMWLWSDGLREETPNMVRLGGTWHMSPIGSCTDEDITIFLKYYATEQGRSLWKQQFPNDRLPPHCPLPYDRDRKLPRPGITQ
jgi:hypothetical protein